MPGAPILDHRETHVLVFTESYPYDVALEATFIEPELPRLRDAFRRVTVIPSRKGGSRATVPEGIEVDESLADVLARTGAISLTARALRSRLLWRDVARRPSLLRYPNAMTRLAGAAGRAAVVRRWFSRFLASQGLRPVDLVAYTFWCDHITTGLTLSKRDHPELVVTSRAHNHDLYAERHTPAYLPFRIATLQGLDGLFPDSEQGVRYVAERHPAFTRCEVARLGVEDPGFVTSPSPPGTFVVVSCSLVVPIKRVELIMQSVGRAALLRPDVRFEWHHVGDGPLLSAVELATRETFPSNATWTFHGQLSLQQLMRFYERQPIDVFINASALEGTPVSIMEAASCSIPVVATAVGGNPEIVSEESGSIVSPNPAPDEIAAAILGLIDDPSGATAKRRASRAVWERKYNGPMNYASFAARLLELRATLGSR